MMQLRLRKTLSLLVVLVSLVTLPLAGALSSDVPAETPDPDRLVLVAHPSFSGNVSADTLYRLYMGKLSQLPDGSPVTPLVAPREAKRFSVFCQEFLGRSSRQLRAHWARLLFTGKGRLPEEVHDSDVMKHRIASEPGYIGYLPMSYVDDSVMVLDR